MAEIPVGDNAGAGVVDEAGAAGGAPPVAPNQNIEDILDKVRRQESEKYSRRLKLLESKNSELEDKLKETESRIAKIKPFGEDTGNVTQNTPVAPKNLDNSDNVFAQELSQMKSKMEKYEKENNELRRTVIVDALVKEFNGEIIPELITGSTQEELLASAEVAAAKYQEIKNGVLKTLAITPNSTQRIDPQIATPPQVQPPQANTGTVPRPVQPNSNRSAETPVANMMASLRTMSARERISYLASQTPEVRDAIKQEAVKEQMQAFNS
jgi:hypothetical protein